MLYHVVLLTLKADARPLLDELVEELNALADLPIVDELAAGVRLGRTGHDAALVVRLAGREQLQAYREHPAHQPVLEKIRHLAEEIEVVDFEI